MENNRPLFVTHGGKFHTDETLAYVILKLGNHVSGIRRLTDIDESNVPKGAIVGDILRVYDHAQKRYDHHQEMLTRPDFYPYATAGLIWKHYGKDTIRHVLYPHKLSYSSVSIIWKYVDTYLMKVADAADSDETYGVKYECRAGEMQGFTLMETIELLNSEGKHSSKSQDSKFQTAATVLEVVLLGVIEDALRYLNVATGKVISFKKMKDRIIGLKEPIRIGHKRAIANQYPDALFLIGTSTFPTSKYTLLSVCETPESRIVKIPIERSSHFEGFIHRGKWCAASNEIADLIELAQYNIKRVYGDSIA